VIATQARNPGGGLIVMPSAFNVTNRDLIIALAARNAVPAIYFNRKIVLIMPVPRQWRRLAGFSWRRYF
jgi:hypothetical protein